MQILGKRSKMLLAALLAVILITLGTSYAVWDRQAALAATGDAASYANAKVGDVIQFGRYWQRADVSGYDDKDPIDWIVVDKDERTGQLTLMSKYILASGSFFGNYYRNGAGAGGHGMTAALLDNSIINQAWSESTARAFLNNLERWDIGGDKFDETIGLDNKNRILSLRSEGKLKPSVGFSNALHYTGLSSATESVVALVNDPNSGFVNKNGEPYYQRPKVTDPTQRLPRNGFLDEAFSPDEKQMIVPREIPGQIAHRWPVKSSSLESAEYIPGTIDKVWLPSVEELNVQAGLDWFGKGNDAWSISSDLASSATFEYFKNYQKYSATNDIHELLKATCTPFAAATGSIGNYSIPGWITDVGDNSTDQYWLRSVMSPWYNGVRIISDIGRFYASLGEYSYNGVRPCIILKY